MVTETSTESELEIQQRIREIQAALFPSINAAARAAGMDAGQLYRAMHYNIPGHQVIERLSAGWHVPAFVFFMPSEMAKPFIETAKNNLAS